jgi:precorrin-6B methylase 2
VIFETATQSLKKVIGIEYDEALVNIAKINLANYKFKNIPIEIIHADAERYDPIEGTVYFLGNPFGAKTLQIVMDNIQNSLETNPRNIKIVYFNSTGKSVLEKLDWLEFEASIDKNYLGTTVWRNIQRPI